MAPVLARHAMLMLRVAGDAPTPLRALGLLSQAWCALWQGRLDEARRLADTARDDAHWSGQTGAVRGHLLAVTAVLEAVSGNARAAIDAAQARVAALQAGANDWRRYVLSLFAARIAATCNDLPALRDALRAAGAARGSLDPENAGALARAQLPVLAQCAWLEGRTDQAISAWQQALTHEEQIDWLGQASETRLRLARAFVRDGAVAKAAELAAPIFERAEQEGGPGGALLAGDALEELATLEWGGALAPAWQAQLREWWHALALERGSVAADPREASGTATSDTKPVGKGEPLTMREMEVLTRIAAGDSNKLIARALDLSPHTVKRHVANILDKLNVETRGQAAAWHRAQPR